MWSKLGTAAIMATFLAGTSVIAYAQMGLPMGTGKTTAGGGTTGTTLGTRTGTGNSPNPGTLGSATAGQGTGSTSLGGGATGTGMGTNGGGASYGNSTNSTGSGQR